MFHFEHRMLIETFDYAVSNRERILGTIDFGQQQEIVQKARGKWNNFQPDEKVADLVGIDSSWNFIPYQGFYVFTVDAVSMQEDGRYLVPPLFTVDLGTRSVRSGDEYVSSGHGGLRC